MRVADVISSAINLNLSNDSPTFKKQLKYLTQYTEACKSGLTPLWKQTQFRKEPKGYVSIKNFVDVFIKGSTKDLGTCLSLQLNQQLHFDQRLLPAEVFVNVSMSENIEQVLDTLWTEIGRKYGDDFGETFGEMTMIWFPAISLYQERVDDQLREGLDKHVLKSCKSMFVIQTGAVNAFSDLWVISALHYAEDAKKQLRFILSEDWKEKYIRQQRTSSEYMWIDNCYRKVRETNRNRVLLNREDIRNGGDNRAFRSLNYLLMDQEEWAVRMERDPTTGRESYKWQAILRSNVLEVSLSF